MRKSFLNAYTLNLSEVFAGLMRVLTTEISIFFKIHMAKNTLLQWYHHNGAIHYEVLDFLSV